MLFPTCILNTFELELMLQTMRPWTDVTCSLVVQFIMDYKNVVMLCPLTIYNKPDKSKDGFSNFFSKTESSSFLSSLNITPVLA